ncbi:hypothetical protein BCR33DRAFT_160966 [Rhizoclosmatium globosum]|uniref:Adhesin domain-containing protein n=1 Tax=Rhizoclosmatium globosum TaxID=329046 RepID=A0A1Y2CGI0_9FUNG|nr:hypothetical protein BCR33DRAFT_160966 [Rhizoclosmatium globosum]|eukprot:ORY46129.1 hypothetical protein BCR33DRAFT_160966 [Rhizoclosmatium globosum]
MSTPEPVTLTDPITSISLESSGSKDALECTVLKTVSQHSTISYTISDPDAAKDCLGIKCVLHDDGKRGHLKILVTFSSKGGVIGWIYKHFTVSMVIKLPQTQPLSSFVYNSEVGNLTYKGPEVVGLLDVSQGIGNIKIMAPLFSQNLRLSCNMGDISIQEQCLVSERVSLKLNMGTGKVIGKGAIVGYSVLEASGNMGDFVMNLRPGVLDSKMDVSCSTGSVKLNVSGFEGIFNIKSTVGSVKVTAPGDISCSKNPCEGIVGEDDAKGALNVITKFGDSKVAFDY